LITLKCIRALLAYIAEKAHRIVTDPEDYSSAPYLNNDAFGKEQRRRMAEVERLTYMAKHLARRDM